MGEQKKWVFLSNHGDLSYLNSFFLFLNVPKDKTDVALEAAAILENITISCDRLITYKISSSWGCF